MKPLVYRFLERTAMTPSFPIRRLFLLAAMLALPLAARAEAALTFGVVPQQSASKLARQWGPLLTWVGERVGRTVRFQTAPDIPEFERRLAQGEYDFAYMNPYHYTVFHEKPGYVAFGHARDNHIKGIMVVRSGAPYRDIEGLKGETLAFPSPAAFAASILTRGEFQRRGLPIKAKYVTSHDSVYRSVAAGLYPAGGGVVRTFEALDASIRAQLRILWTTPGYTPHALAAHPRVAAEMVTKVQAAMVSMAGDVEGRLLLEPLQIKGWQAAVDSDWDDVRALDIGLLDDLVKY